MTRKPGRPVIYKTRRVTVHVRVPVETHRRLVEKVKSMDKISGGSFTLQSALTEALYTWLAEK